MLLGHQVESCVPCQPNIDEQIVLVQEKKQALDAVIDAIEHIIVNTDAFYNIDEHWIRTYGDAKLTAKRLAKSLEELYAKQEVHVRNDC